MRKYRNKPVVLDGITFASKREANRWIELRMLEKAGQITLLSRQVVIPLQGQTGPLVSPSGRKRTYIADFRYWDVLGKAWVIEDAKGFETDTFKLKRDILAAQGLTVKTV